MLSLKFCISNYSDYIQEPNKQSLVRGGHLNLQPGLKRSVLTTCSVSLATRALATNVRRLCSCERIEVGWTARRALKGIILEVILACWCDNGLGYCEGEL